MVDISHPKRSILILAAQTGFLSILRALLAAYDWRSYQRALDLALISAMKIGHSKCINLLMDNGANPDAVDWWLVYQSYDADILSRFLTEKKNLDSFICELGGNRETPHWSTQESYPQSPRHGRNACTESPPLSDNSIL